MPLCNTPFVAKLHFAQFPGPPPRVLPEMRISREPGGMPSVRSPPLNTNHPQKLSGKNQLILHVDASLTQQLRYRIALQS